MQVGRDAPTQKCGFSYLFSVYPQCRGNMVTMNFTSEVAKPALMQQRIVTSNLLAITECRFHLAERREDGSTVSLQLHVG